MREAFKNNASSEKKTLINQQLTSVKKHFLSIRLPTPYPAQKGAKNRGYFKQGIL
jgi:hypothetical protein